MAGYDFSKDVIQRSGLLPDSLVVTAATFCAGTAATTFAQPVE
jgi:xanthine/uracil permease